MKTSLMLAFATVVSSSVMAQTVTNAPAPPAPAAVITPAVPETKPAPAPAKKKTVPRKKAAPAPVAAVKKTPGPATPLIPGPATVNADNVNVRGQARLSSERVAQVQAGETVTVLEEIILDKPATDEPARWARIALPAGTKVWVNTTFLDAATKTVSAARLNLRSGPGENYSIVGLVEKGEQLAEAGSVKGDWMQVEAPKTAYAFVASQYLKQEAPALAAVPPPAPPTPPVAPPTAPPAQPVLEAPPVTPVAVAPPVVEPPAVTTPLEPVKYKSLPLRPASQPDSRPIAKSREALRRKMAEMAAANIPTDATPAAEPPPPRIVAHEGVVRGSWSVQAPTPFILVNPATGKTINYLYTTSTNLNLNNYKGLRIVVTGEEGLDSRWKNTPVLTIQRIQVIE